jgi:hypothetical protein
MNDLDTIDFILLNASATLAQRSQANAMSDDIKTLDALTRLDQRRIQRDSTLHNSIGEIWVWQGIPVVLLIRTSQDSATT